MGYKIVRRARGYCTFNPLIFLFFLLFLGSARAENRDAYYYYQVGDWPKAAELYAASLGEKPRTEDLNQAAEAFYRRGHLKHAEELAKKALSQRDNPDSRILLLLIKAGSGEREEAARELEAMQKDGSHDYKVLTAMGTMRAQKDPSGALRNLLLAVDKEPEYFPAWFNIGLIYEESEMFEKATNAYKNAVRINPLSAQAHNNLGYSYKERHFYSYAAEEYRKAIELMPDNPGYYYNIGNAYTHEEKIDDAFNAYRRALELDPKFAKAHYNMARTYLRKDMVTEAIGEFRLYLKYGNKEIFSFVASRSSVEDEIEQLELYLANNPPQRPSAGRITK